MIDDAELRACLSDRWGLAGATIEVHDGGMNSATWFVDRGDRRWVAKAVVGDSRRSFVGGLAVAGRVAASGIPTGVPVATRHGEIIIDIGGVPLALLSWVAGAGLSGRDPSEQRLIGTTLAHVHRVLADEPVDDPERFHWVDPDGGHLAVRSWVQPAVAAAVAAYDTLGSETLSWGLLHTDPAPEAFRLDRTTGVCGLIDWSVAMVGPLLYDLASAVMYAGGAAAAHALIESYLDDGPVGRAEVDRGLETMLRFRWAVQADYFARRIASDDLTGIATAADNDAGLDDARAGLDR